jgi:hypothetical protein
MRPHVPPRIGYGLGSATCTPAARERTAKQSFHRPGPDSVPGLRAQAGEHQLGNVLRQAGQSEKSGGKWQTVDGG